MSSTEKVSAVNLLPFDGTVHYYGKILPSQFADRYFELLLNNIAWKNDGAIIFGRKIITKRKVAWYGDQHFSYTYSNSSKEALPWTPELSELKKLVEDFTGAAFNACLLNLYHSGEEGVSWHSDDEKALEQFGSIASLSFGAERQFSFSHKFIKQKTSILLEHGSLLLMKDKTQANWLHALPKSKKIISPRINLTFRRMMNPTKL